MRKKEKKWIRYRFATYSVDDPRPLIFNPSYPFWESAFNDNEAIIIAWLPEGKDLFKYWDDAHDITYDECDKITFSDRFPKPSYFVEP